MRVELVGGGRLGVGAPDGDGGFAVVEDVGGAAG